MTDIKELDNSKGFRSHDGKDFTLSTSKGQKSVVIDDSSGKIFLDGSAKDYSTAISDINSELASLEDRVLHDSRARQAGDERLTNDINDLKTRVETLENKVNDAEDLDGFFSRDNMEIRLLNFRPLDQVNLDPECYLCFKGRQYTSKIGIVKIKGYIGFETNHPMQPGSRVEVAFGKYIQRPINQLIYDFKVFSHDHISADYIKYNQQSKKGGAGIHYPERYAYLEFRGDGTDTHKRVQMTFEADIRVYPPES